MVGLPEAQYASSVTDSVHVEDTVRDDWFPLGKAFPVQRRYRPVAPNEDPDQDVPAYCAGDTVHTGSVGPFSGSRSCRTLIGSFNGPN